MKTKNVKWKTKSGDISAYGLSEQQSYFLFKLLTEALNTIDQREQHFMLMVVTREDESDVENDMVSSNMISSMPREFMHDTIRQWLHKETQ